jgi:hypothetical protein
MQLIKTLKQLFRRRDWKPGPQATYSPKTFEKIIRQIEQTQDVEFSCDDVHRVLDQFAEAFIRGEDVGKLMPLVQRRLDMCPDCREEFEALLRVLRAPTSDASAGSVV